MTSSIWIDDVTVGEQDGFADFVIRLDAPASAQVTVNYSTAPSTASNYSDFIPVSGALTFAPGETVKTVSVQLVDDAVEEATEVFTMNLSSPSANATIARASATATIIDNDAPSGTPQVSINNLVVDEADGTANFVITLDRPSTGVVSINYATQDGAPITGAAAAQAGSDYVAASGTLNFAPGETAKTVKVQLINDTLPEGDEAFSLKLSGLVGATALNPVGTAVIAANDERVVSKASISIDDVTVGEQDGFADFVIRLDAPTSAPLTVNYSTAPSTASNYSDFIPVSGALTFAPGETVKTVRVQLVDDAVAEGTEVFTMNLSSPSANATIARASATATIIDNDAPSGTPQVSINDLVVDEADGTANFVITLDRPSTGVVSINYATQDGAPITGAAAAQAGSDYVAASGTLNFAPGETAKTVKVALINDTLPEGDEAFSLKLSGLVGATALNPVGTAVIAANDEPVVSKASISIDDVTVGEQDGFADFVIRLDAPTSAPLTVNYSTAPSTASNYSDFIPVSGALTFAPGETVKTVSVQVVDDPDTEATEVFKMNLSTPSANATIARATATATIIDNDAPSGTPQVSINDLVVDEAAGTANFVITFDRPSAGVVSINYATQDGTALAGSDYVAEAGTLKFAPGETAKTVKVQLINDTLPEGDEAFSLKLSGLVGATALNPVGTAVIAANDEPVVSKASISIDDVTVGEQDGFADFVIRLDAPTSAPLTVNYSTAPSTASNYSDFIPVSGALTFAPGETVKTVSVQVVDDPDTEATEVFKMNLSTPSANATIARASATATIIDNDAPSGTPQVSINDLVVDEAAGTANFVITFDRPSAGVVSINYATQDGTALAGSDYVAASGTLNFAPGETAKTVKVLVINDTVHEGPETFSLALSNLVGATSLDPIGTATITDNDVVMPPPPPTGDNDILFQNVSGQAAIWDVSGATLTSSALLGANPGPNWKDVGTGDFNDDMLPDILLQNTNGNVAVWETNGTSVTSSAVVASPGANWKTVGTGDFNDDGKSDILLQNTNGAVAIWDMNGTSITDSAVVANPGANWKAVGTGDFNDDGHSDILLQNTNGAVAIWEMNGANGTNVADSAVVANPGANWKVVGTGDFNGDGHSDILLQNTNGNVAIWEMNGGPIS